MLFLNTPQPPFHTHLPCSSDGPQKIFVIACYSALEGDVDGDIPREMGLEVIPLHQDTTAKKWKSNATADKDKAKPSSGDFLRLYPDGKDNLEFLKSPGLHVKVNFFVNPILLSDIQAASSCLSYNKIHLNYLCLLSIKEEDDEHSEQAQGVLYVDQLFKMCASMLSDGGTIRLIYSKNVFEQCV